jgi:hypothetical protein
MVYRHYLQKAKKRLTYRPRTKNYTNQLWFVIAIYKKQRNFQLAAPQLKAI